MTANEPKKKKRRVQTQVSEDIGRRLDRLAEVYRTTVVPDSAITTIKASTAMRAVIHIGLDAEEKRLGLPPLEPVLEAPAPPKPTSSKRKARRRPRAGRT
jgi:predicted transcriptional regulator